jgi:Xaa-Pro aminopeptidase
MFEAKLQTFTDSSQGSQGPARVAALRQKLAAMQLDGFLVPRADEHQGEYVPACDERLAWLTGFTGSAGAAVVLMDKAALFIDGRYTEQAKVQTDRKTFERVPVHEVSIGAWLGKQLGSGAVLGYDPALHTPGEIDRLAKAAAGAGASLKAVAANPIDALWTDRPAPPLARIALHPLQFAGETAAKKIARVQKALVAEKLDGLLVSDPHGVAWLFNIRGGDVQYTPLPLSYAYVPATGKPVLFISPVKVPTGVAASLEKVAVLAHPRELEPRLTAAAKGARIRLDGASAGVRFKSWIEAGGGTANVGSDPIALMKAAKNAAEQDGTRNAHIRDGAAMARFLCWFDANVSGGLTEIDAVAALETFRREAGIRNLSFPAISGANRHAALPHYRVTEKSNAKIETGVFLIDSGGQYEDGTTDITRTIAVGKPTKEIKDRNTRVLKGMIAISRIVFPKGTSGAQLDAFARASLWQAGLDYDHGTGHGVGSYLSVHEGPQRLSKLGTTPLEPGMILSNEPGYYKPGAFGIRIENLIIVQKIDIPGAEREMLGFETISFAPIDTRLIEPKLMTAEEIAWLNTYHKQVRAKLSPLLDRKTVQWLRAATAAI